MSVSKLNLNYLFFSKLSKLNMKSLQFVEQKFTLRAGLEFSDLGESQNNIKLVCRCIQKGTVMLLG